jgi:hypothetical protein
MAQTLNGSATRLPDDPDTQDVPSWVDEGDHYPLRYEREVDSNRHRYILGRMDERHAVVLSARGPLEIPTEELVGLAAGAFQAVAGRTCDRAEAEVIAKGWMLASRRAMQ